MPPRILCLAPDSNAPGKHDATGAFWPESAAYALSRGESPLEAVKFFPARAPLQTRRAFCTQQIRNVAKRIDTLAFFCHGYRSGIQAGWTLNHVIHLSKLLLEHATVNAHVILYACESGGESGDRPDTAPGPGGDGGFADGLRDACEILGREIAVTAHSTTGHTTRNPYVRRFSPGYGGKGGAWYVEPGSPLWPRWVRALRDPDSTLRFRFPHMSSAEIAAELEPHVA